MLFKYYEKGIDHINEITKKYHDEFKSIEALEERMKLISAYNGEISAVIEGLKNEWFDKLAHDPKRIYEDAAQYIPALIEDEYNQITAWHNDKSLKEIADLGTGKIEKGRLYVYDNHMFLYVCEDLAPYFKELERSKTYSKKLKEQIIKELKKSPYTCAYSADHAGYVLSADNMPMYNGKPIKLMARIKGIPAEISNGKAVYRQQKDSQEYEFILRNFNALKGNIGINTHKLLCVAIAEFTRLNNYGGGNANPEIVIPLKDYARSLKYDIDENPKNTPEDIEKEKKRAANALKDARKKIKNDIDLLLSMQWSWEENTRKETPDYMTVNLFDKGGIEKGYIKMRFGETMSTYLKRLPLTQYPKGLLAIDARKDNAYRIGLKISEHYNMDHNIIIQTNDRLTVKTLLGVTTLPTYDDLKSQGLARQWEQKIKDRLEDALEALTGKVIKSWEYVKAKGEPLTDQEAFNINDYETFSSLLVHIEPLIINDQAARIERNQKAKEAAIRAKAKKKSPET